MPPKWSNTVYLKKGKIGIAPAAGCRFLQELSRSQTNITSYIADS